MRSVVYATLLAISFYTSNAVASNLFVPTSKESSLKILDNAQHIPNKNKVLYSALSVDKPLLKSLKIHDTLNFNLPDGTTQGIVSRIYQGSSGAKHVVVRSVVKGVSVSSVLTFSESDIYLDITTQQGLLSGIGVGEQVLLHNPREVAKANKVLEDDAIVLPPKQTISTPETTAFLSQREVAQNTTDEDMIDNGEMATLDVFFVYSTNVHDVIKDIDTRIDHLIAYANQVFEDSGIFVEVRFKGKLEVDYPYTIGQVALSDIRNGNSPFEEVDKYRFQSGADAVALLIPQTEEDGSAGIAYLNGHLSSSSADAMFSQTDVDAGASTFVHEIGHNLGLGHSRPQGNRGADFPYGVGFRIPAPNNRGFNTIMSYSTQGASDEFPLFSNPEKLCGAFPCGVSKHDSEYGADAVSAVNAVRHIVSAYGKEDGDVVSIDDAILNVADTNLAQCIQNNIYNDRKFAHQLKQLYCYDTINDLSGLEFFNELETLYLNDVPVDDIAALASLTELESLSIFGLEVTEFSVLGSLQSLQTLKLQANNFNNESATKLLQLTRLRQLDIASQNLTELPNLRDLPLLEELSVTAPIVSLEPLLQNQQLTSLYVYSDHTRFPSQVNWPVLETLSLYGGNVTSLDTITGLTSLRELTLSFTGLNNINGVSQLPNLYELNIASNNITDVSELENLTQLTSLDVSNNPIDDVSVLSSLTQLEVFKAGAWGQTQDWTFVSDLNELKQLGLTGIDKPSFDALTSLRDSIEYLDLNEVNTSDISGLFDFFRLDSLYLHAASYTRFYCWQQQYLERMPFQYGNVISDCDPSDDANDFDGDGINNIDEINAQRNPIENDNNVSSIEFLSTSLTFNEALDTVTHQGVIRRKGNSTISSSVSLTASNITTDDSDYYLPGTNIYFENGENTQPFQIYIENDFVIEGKETFNVTLSEPVDATLGEKDTLVIEINDDIDGSDYIPDTKEETLAPIGWESTYISVDEAEEEVTIILNRPSGVTGGFSVDIVAIALTENTENTFHIDNTSLVFTESEMFKAITVRFDDDDVFAANRYIGLRLSNPVDIRISDSLGALTIEIFDDESDKRKIQFAQTSYNISEDDNYVDIALHRDGNDTVSREVTLYQASGSATFGKDLTFSSNTVVFSPNDTEKVVRLRIVDDNFYEGYESLQLGIEGMPSDIRGHNWSTFINIADNDNRGDESGRISFAQSESVVSEDEGTYIIKVIRSGDLSLPLLFRYTTVSGTATADDFLDFSSTEVFEPGENEMEINLHITDDSIVEGDEFFSVTLDANDGHLGELTSHRITITENTTEATGLISVEQTDIVVFEGGVAELVLNRTGGSEGERVINLRFTDETTSRKDYLEIRESIVFGPGETRKVVLISIVDDAVDEFIETFNVYLEGENYNYDILETPYHANIHIIDNDKAKTTPFDYDGDGISDIVIRRPDLGQFLVARSTDNKIMRTYFGSMSSDIPLAGDFDGDGITDVTIRRGSSKQFIHKTSSTGKIARLFFGSQDEDIPVIADYDGDGIDDIAIRRPSTGQWFIKYSSTGEIIREIFGQDESDIPVVADYDGDGKVDLAVRRRSAGQFIIKRSSTGEIDRIGFGSQYSDIAVPADYDGDGKADIAIRRPENGFWYIKRSSDNVIERTFFGSQWDDIPVVADYDGDGISDIAIRRPSTGNWIVKLSSDGSYKRYYFGGQATDVPLAAPMQTVLSMVDAVSQTSTSILLNGQSEFEILPEATLVQEVIKTNQEWETKVVEGAEL